MKYFKMTSLNLRDFLAVALLIGLSVISVESLSCYKCGKLSSSARFVEDCNGEPIAQECSANEVCVVFKRLYKRGSASIRGCFAQDGTLPGINGLTPKSACQFQPERRSSVKACMCNSDLCNDREYDLHTQRANRLFGNKTSSSSSLFGSQQRARVSKEDDKEDRSTSRNQGVEEGSGLGVEGLVSGEEVYKEEAEDQQQEQQDKDARIPEEEEEDYDEALYNDFVHLIQNTSSHSNVEARVPRQSNVADKEPSRQTTRHDQLNRHTLSLFRKPRAADIDGKTSSSSDKGSSLRERLAVFMSQFGATPSFNFNQQGRIDCKWSNFSDWSECSQSCNGGVQFRERKILILARQGGTPCRGERKESRVCNTQQCPPDFVGDVPDVICPLINVIGATYANCDGRYKVTNNEVPWAKNRPVYKHTRKNRYIFWNAGGLGWSIGKREYLKTGSHWHRSGLDTDEPWQGDWEEGVRVECIGGSKNQDRTSSSADDKSGVVNCLWSSYGQWSRCSVSCGVGTEQRKRMVLQQASVGGKPCQGESIESRTCNTGVSCPVNCEWSNFSRWSACSTTCGGGRQTRRRSVTKKASGGGRPCSGGKTESRPCNKNSCSRTDRCCEQVVVKANGNAKLDQSLYLGVYNKISDRYNGRFAYEREGREQLYIYFFRSQADNLNLWVIGPELGQFIAGIRNDGQETCIHETVQEWKYASRAGVWKDDDPTLQVECYRTSGNGGTTVGFVDREPTTTTTTELPIIRNRPRRVDCEWSSYGEWSPCSKSCGRGIQFRTRRVIKAPQNGGANCVGSNKDTRSCNVKSCSLFTTTTTRPPTTSQFAPSIPKSKPIDPNRRVKCFACGSLFSTDAPECNEFDVSDPNQQTTCARGEACLWYSYHKSAGDVAIIRECFSTSILLGSIENPIAPSHECLPRPVENDDSIMACICATDFCNGYDGGKPVNLQTTTTPSPFRLPQSQTERPRSQVGRPQAPSPNQIDRNSVRPTQGRVLCHQCGSLFSGSGNPPCEDGNAGKTEYCKDGEACLWYSWKKSNIETSIIRECFSKSILLGSIDKPLQLRRECNPQDISETRGSKIFACLCDTERCNANGEPGEDSPGQPDNGRFQLQQQNNQERTQQNSRIQTTTRHPTSSFSQTPKPTQFNPPPTQPPQRAQNTFSGGPGLQCYSCGSLLNPDAKCDKFNPSDPSQIQTCESGEACLLYKWKKSDVETAVLRECFSKSVLLGSIDNPLLPTSGCNIRDISEPQSSSIEACLCTTDFCNDDLGRGPGGEATSDLKERQTTRSRFADTTATTIPARGRFTDTTRSSNLFERTTKSSTFFDQNSRASTPFRPNFDDLPDKLNFNKGEKSSKTSCPRGYTLTNTGCYKISQRRMGWIEAKKRCESENGNLVAIDSEEEKDALLELISESSPRTRLEYWLGGNDIEIENRWVWSGFGNTKLVPDFGWLDRPVPSDEENCLTWSITLSRKGSRRRPTEGWHSDSCCNDIRFICELK